MIITKEGLNRIVEHARGKAPEVCGLLAGTGGRVSRVYQMTNTEAKPETGYFMDPQEQLKVMKEIRKQGLELLGIYHSHPSSAAYPSPRDVEQAFYSEVSYLIVSLLLKEPEVRVFKIEAGQIREEKIVTSG
ncbi:MAG: M67 family metallopeptidase [Candidatus Margulisiibacteriota bacterium]